MKITGKNKTVEIPTWALVLAMGVVDNVLTNVCKIVDNRNLRKVTKEISKNETH